MRATLCAVVLLVACGPSGRKDKVDGGGGDDDAPSNIDSFVDPCPRQCSPDTHAVLDCHGNVLQQCDAADACDSTQLNCTNACLAAENNHRSIGCDYYATDMDSYSASYCFAAFVANTWTSPAHITVSRGGAVLPVANFTRIPSGSGPSISYNAYDANAGLPPGQVAILFLSGATGGSPNCPIPAAVSSGGDIAGTGLGASFHIETDVPIVAYQINPYGGGSVAVTAASLLIPSSAWDKNYVAVNVSPQAAGVPSMNIIAREDQTMVTIVPNQTISGGGGIPTVGSGQPLNMMINKGQYIQISQGPELTGSTVTGDKPIGFMAGHTCMNMPVGVSFCDHGEQMIPPVRAMASKYVGAMYRPRTSAETSTFWRVVGAVDGTTLTYSTPVGGPATLNKGQAVTFQTGTPFVVMSQDKDHPFMLFQYMTGSNFVTDGYGDPDFAVIVPPEQYLQQYVFFADPTYPETNLVMIRARANDGFFKDVNLDCLGNVTGWQPIGSDYEWARADLQTGNFQNVGNCSTGRHEIKSTGPFGLWIWGWGTPLTSTFTANVSYGYPGGMNVTPINDVIIF